VLPIDYSRVTRLTTLYTFDYNKQYYCNSAVICSVDIESEIPRLESPTQWFVQIYETALECCGPSIQKIIICGFVLIPLLNELINSDASTRIGNGFYHGE